MASQLETEAENIAEPKPPRFSKKKKIIAAAVGALVLLAGAGAWAVSGGGAGDDAAHETQSDADGQVSQASMIDVPPMVVNLRSRDGERRFVRIHFMIVPTSAAKAEVIRERLPIIIDSYQPFLRELRPEDLAGSAAVYRLKEELLLRAANTVGTDSVSDILIQDLVQQ